MQSKCPWFFALSCVAMASVILCARAALAQAGSDHCAAAPAINANQTYHGSNVGATSDIAQSSCSLGDSFDVWYKFTASSAGDYTIDTLGSVLDTTLVVYSVCGGAPLACNDDVDPGFDTSSLVGVTLLSGQTIRIRVAGYAADQGAFDIFITPPTIQPTTGACCQGSTCVVLAPAACTGPGNAYAGGGVACNALGNNTTPCCKANFNGGILSVQDIFDVLTAWFSGSPRADFNGGGLSVQDIFDFLQAWFAGC